MSATESTRPEFDEGRILVVDDEEAMRAFLRRLLEKKGFQVACASSGVEARTQLVDSEFDLVLTDVRMPEMDGLELLSWIRREQPRVPVIVMTGFGSIPDAIAALKAGAENYVTKPFDREEILKALRQALLTNRLATENALLKRLLAEGRRFEGLVGSSESMRKLYRDIEIVAARDGVVLVQGESGTGKELVARAIHARSERSSGPFVPFHCAAIPPDLLAAELFGVEEGAFTGAKTRRDGYCVRAEGGTLFLDEIGDAPIEVQPALLRLLESGEVSPLGSHESRRINLRIVAATHRDLAAEVEAGRFRQDLYFRFHVLSLSVPPLRRRRDDVGDLVSHFLALAGEEEGRINLEARALLEGLAWPGNVRQLQNTVERMLALGRDGALSVEDVPEDCRLEARDEAEETTLKDAVRNFERDFLERLLRVCGGNISEAARRAGTSRPTLHAKMQALGLDADRFR